MKQTFKPSEVCFLLGCSRDTLKSWLIKSGLFKESKRGHHGLIKQREFKLSELQNMAGYFAQAVSELTKPLTQKARKERLSQIHWLLFLAGDEACVDDSFGVTEHYVQALSLLALKSAGQHKRRAKIWEILFRNAAKKIR